MMTKTMRSMVLGVAIVAVIACPARAEFITVNSFSDVSAWAGSGANEAGFVLQFGDSQSPTSIAWGYRWDGAASVQDMMFALAGTTTISGGPSVPPGLDSRLAVNGSQFDFGGGPVVFINSITYDQVGLPAEWSQVSRQIIDNFVNDGTFPSLYSNAGAAGLWTGATMDFAAAAVGISELALADGGWYGFVQTVSAFPDPEPPFAFSQPVSAVAVPEPGTWVLTAGAIVAAWAFRRRSIR